MDTIGDRTYVKMPGTKIHELPPLLINAQRRAEMNLRAAQESVDQEYLISSTALRDLEQFDLAMQSRKIDLALNLVNQYESFHLHWQWGDNVLEWIRQCKATFNTRLELRNLLPAPTKESPHADQPIFVVLLKDKAVDTGGVELEKAIGMRLTFREPPSIHYLSNQFLFYLNPYIANAVYKTWAGMNINEEASLPPERFIVEVEKMPTL